MDSKYDVVIIGSGLGGLECGIILSKEGYNVCVLEQANLFGGCLQSFKRNGHTIDTGMHYLGSMADGQIMNQYFKYFGILDNLNYMPLDNDFDNIILGDKSHYSYKNGIADFKENLIQQFPTQKCGIQKYCDKISSIGESISVDIHKLGAFSTRSIDNLSTSASQFIDECVDDVTLQNVLAATNPLYGGVKERSNLYHHSMVNYSNIQGAVRFVGGTQHVADAMVDKIREQGGTVLNRSKVASINMGGDKVASVTLENGEMVFASHFISDIHPTTTFALLSDTPLVKKAYKSRFGLLSNTYPIFSVYLLMKEDSLKYINNNVYCYKDNNVWNATLDSNTLKPNSALISTQLACKDSEYADVITLLSPIAYDLFAKWSNSKLMMRGQDYDELKEQISQNIIDFVSEYKPEIAPCVEKVYSASPLTYEHYIGTPQGSAYGLLKDYKSALVTLLPAKTKVSNLLLTGQNLNVHGALGVTLTAAVTCSELIGENYLAKKIGNA